MHTKLALVIPTLVGLLLTSVLAWQYSGKYIARRLLEQGATVKTLTRTPTSHSPFGDRGGGSMSGLRRL